MSELHGRVSSEMWKALFPEGERVSHLRHHQRRAHRNLDRAGDARLPDQGIRSRLGLAPSRPRSLGETRETPPTRVWSPPGEPRRSDSSAMCASAPGSRRAARAPVPPTCDDWKRSSIRAALTIGFARRFATYKRAVLLLQDLDRAKALLLDPAASGSTDLRRKGPSGRPGRAGIHPATRGPGAAASCGARSSSSRTTTSTWPGCSCRAWMSGSTPPENRSRPPERPVRRPRSTAP